MRNRNAHPRVNEPMTRLTHVAGRFPLPVLKHLDALVGEMLNQPCECGRREEGSCVS